MATINNSVLNNVYNYYQADLVPRSSSNRFDSHNKKDLKDIYRSIVKISKDEPVFLLDRSKEIEEYSIHMKESAISFKKNIAAIGGTDEEDMFDRKAAFSSDPDVVELKGFPGAEKGSETAENVRLSVQQLATPQENRGKYLHDGRVELPEGNYSFDVETQNSNYELQFTVSATDTNKDIQNRLSRLINNFKLGLHAEVEEDGVGNSALVIRSKNVGDRSGEGGHFSISDEETSQQGGIVDYLGIRGASSYGQDAIFTENGVIKRAGSNDVHLDSGFDVLLKDASPGREVTIGYKADVESMKDNIISLAGSYNDFVKATAEYMDRQPRTGLLVNDMKKNSQYYTDMLEKIGVSQKEDGTLDVDEETLAKTLGENDSAEELGALKNFTKFAVRKAEELQLNPMDYVDKRIVAYKNPTTPHYANPYVTSAYSGMLFNGYM